MLKGRSFGSKKRKEPEEDYDAKLIERVVRITQEEALAGRTDVAWQLILLKAFAEERRKRKKSKN